MYLRCSIGYNELLANEREPRLEPGSSRHSRIFCVNAYFSILADLHKEAVLTATLAVLVLVAGYVATLAVERGKSVETKRFWRLTVRHTATAVFFLGLFGIWRSELQTLLLALGAATAGFLVAFREHWMSLLAFWVRVVKRTYNLDDFIEIDGQRGRVTDITWLSTTLAETASAAEGFAYSGRVLHVPNNRMLLAPLAVENLAGEYGAHTLKLHLPPGANILQAKALLAECAELHCGGFFAGAEQYMARLRNESDIDCPAQVQPRVRIHIADQGHATLLMRVVVPFKQRARIEQAILHEFFTLATPDVWPNPKLNRSAHV